MTDTAFAVTEERIYGGWRKPTSYGLGRLGLLGSMVLLSGIIVTTIVLAAFGVLASLPVLFATGLAVGPMVYQDRNGRTGVQWLTARTAWGRGHLAGQHIYRAGPLARVGHGNCSIPGLGAKLEAMDVPDSYGRPFALLHHPSAGHVSAVLSTTPDGASLVDPDQLNAWVAHWSGWLAGLSDEPSLVAASVTIEAAPDTGLRLRREVDTRIAADSPALARQVLGEIVDTYPAGSATITSRVALTWSTDPRPGQKRRALADMALDIGARLPGLANDLGTTGAGRARAMTTAELASAVRVAYDPAVHGLLDQAVDEDDANVDWTECGPTAQDEYWDRLRHDSGTSISWHMAEAPRGLVYASILARLLAPHTDVARKRVTLLYRPHTPAEATKMVEKDKRDASAAATGKRVVRARALLGMEQADRAATEEARGAGVVRFGMIVTATVTDSQLLEAAAVAVDNLATTSRIRLRRAYGSQSSAFVAGLPLGMVLPTHLRVPAVIREAM